MVVQCFHVFAKRHQKGSISSSKSCSSLQGVPEARQPKDKKINMSEPFGVEKEGKHLLISPNEVYLQH